MAHGETHEARGGGGWFLTFILSFGLWGGLLLGIVTLGHHLAK